MGLQKDRVVVVTGASRGVGKGVALALGSTGATVYITGRTVEEGTAPLPGTIHQTAEEVTARGGKGIAVQCDHKDDAQVEALFKRVADEQGHLDILVNNVTNVPDELTQEAPFWEKPLRMYDDLIDVGLRSHYVASYYAAPLMVGRREGLIVNISSFGANCFLHTTAYGIGKAGVDKLAIDAGKELKPYNVAAVSLWLGIVLTERTMAGFTGDEVPETYKPLLEGLESQEFSGRVIDALANDPNLMEKSGRVWLTAELAEEYGVTDVGGNQPKSYRDMLGAPFIPSDVMIV